MVISYFTSSDTIGLVSRCTEPFQILDVQPNHASIRTGCQGTQVDQRLEEPRLKTWILTTYLLNTPGHYKAEIKA